MLILCSTANLRIPAFREPQKHSQLQHPFYLPPPLLTHFPKGALQDALASWPHLSTHSSAGTDRLLCAPWWAGHFHFCTILSHLKPRIIVKSVLGWDSGTPVVGSPQNCCDVNEYLYWLKIEKLFKFLQMSNADYHHCSVPVTCSMHTHLLAPVCREIICRACLHPSEKYWLLCNMKQDNKSTRGTLSSTATHIKCTSFWVLSPNLP